ncbi:fatty acid desaturase [Pseudorhodobacter sp. E13]|uniref:fatty acid desaturase n=1 Tax=Pseudorhodobacter sp. E13 TaxID=2487931 RepID=UPI000F8ECB38|nr:fatty acid desaturase [Pseudorhodobacter sp. E13]RUS58640.1 fatty acid desaturase [Pseudorhodobacter sp. E13]
MSDRIQIARVEWQTLLLLLATYALWGVGTTLAYGASPVLGIVLTGVAITQFSSLQHEALHGHPFRIKWLNEALVSPALTLTVPYGRFRDTHLAHHNDPALTDPYDDPESNYFDPAVWAGLPRPVQALFRANNTLLGRVVLGPIIGNTLWLLTEARLVRANAPGVRRDWALHALGLVPVVLWLWWAAMPLWAYLLAAYLGHAILKIRTFLEHRAHEVARARTVVVEDRGPLSLLFLNNNLHSVHHCHPGVPWYHLPRIYAARRAEFLAGNDGYAYSGYGAVFRAHLLRAKDPVPHPLYPTGCAEPLDSR